MPSTTIYDLLAGAAWECLKAGDVGGFAQMAQIAEREREIRVKYERAREASRDGAPLECRACGVVMQPERDVVVDGVCAPCVEAL